LVMVGPGGSATVVYEDGCKVDVRPGAVTTIAPLSPCAAGSNAQTSDEPDCIRQPSSRPCAARWAVIGVAVGAGVAVGIAIARTNRAASP